MQQNGRSRIKKNAKFFLPILMAVLIYGLINQGFPCFIREATGLPCPSCGIGRACLAAMRLDMQEAFYWHPLWPLVPILFLLGLLAWQTIKPLPALKHFLKNRIFFWLLIGLAILVYFWRMYDLFPDKEPLNFNQNAYYLRFWAKIMQLFSKH